MLFDKINFSEVIINYYMQSWYIWIGLFLFGVFLVKYAHHIGTTSREIKKRESSGAGLISLSVVVHFVVIWALL